MKLDKLKYLASVIENITDVVTILEANGHVRYQSASITPVFGYDPDEMVGKSIFDYIHPEDRPAALALLVATVPKPDAIVNGELRFKHKNNSWRTLRFVAKNALFNLDVRGVVITSHDVTEIRKAEERMVLVSAALEVTANGVVITDVNGNIVWVNKSFSKMTGYSLEEAIGKNPRILKSGEQPKEVYSQLWSTLMSGEVWSGELINRRKDGELYFEYMTITPLFDASGDITHFIAVKENISERKKLEAEYRQAQKMEAVGRLAGGIAHDFNNLLTVIIGRSQLLLQDAPADSPLRDDFNDIYKTGLRAAELTKQLLAFSRKQVFQAKVADINSIVQGSEKIMRRLVGEDVEVVCILGKNLKPIKVDASQIDQVIMNLVVNSRDAMPKGGKITIETKAEELRQGDVSIYPGLLPGEYTVMTVTDTGTGIPRHVLAHIFEPFFTTKEKGKGTGLGLSMVYGIIKQSHGFIYAESREGKGATFKMYFPPAIELPPAKGPAITAQRTLEGIETILLVEDEEVVRSIASQVLSKHGYRVLEARNGVEALRIAGENKGEIIKLLLTDVVMPLMGGAELAEKFSASFGKTKMIFASGYVAENMEVDKWLKTGHSYLQKPYSPGQLLVAVREALDK